MAEETDFVTPAAPVPPQTVWLTPVDQIMDKIYVNFILCFALPKSTSSREVYAKLKSGLALTLSEIPFIGGVVAREDGMSGRYQIKIDQGYGVRFIFRDFATTSTFEHSYEEMQRAKFPSSMLDAKKLSPFGWLPTSATPAVMGAQANFFTDGLLLTISIIHLACDAHGIAEVIKAWAKNSHSPQAPIPPARSMDRMTLMKGQSGADIIDLTEYPVLEIQKDMPKGKADVATKADPRPPIEYSIFHFSPAHLAQLKHAASSPNPDDPWISTNDALCAFLWHRISLARRLSSPSSSSSHLHSMLTLAVDGRNRFSPTLPPSYLGNAAFICPITSPPFPSPSSSPSSSSSSLPYTLASHIRTTITNFNNKKMRAIIALVDSIPNPTTELKLKRIDKLGRDLAVSSWADMGLYELDWGMGIGKAECVRVPALEQEMRFAGWIRVLPRLRGDGGLEVMVGLEEGVVERLRGDEGWSCWAELVC